MPTLPCPACGHALIADVERCPSCDYPTAIAYRYRLIAERGAFAGGILYEGADESFGNKVAVVFIADPSDASAVERFVEGNRLFAELGGRGLIKIHEVSSALDKRPFVVMDWLEGGTLEQRVQRDGALDYPTLIDFVSALLAGLGKAHRSIPPIVHGHVHPGKIGFRKGGDVVLFGFEWARQTDAFASGSSEPRESLRSRDLQQLGVAIHYAATGAWIGDLSRREQIERTRGEIQGPIGTLVARMLDPDEGYASTLEAQQDLERLLAGDVSWRPRTNSFDMPPAIPPAVDYARQQLQQQLATQQDQPKKSAKGVMLTFVGMSVFGTCVAGVMADIDSSQSPPPSPPQVRFEPVEVPKYEPPPLPEPIPAPRYQEPPDAPQPAVEPERDKAYDPSQDVDCLLDPQLPKCQRGAADSEAPPEPSLPRKLGVSDIKTGLDQVKAAAKACGEQHGAPPGTAVMVKFEIEGETGETRSAEVVGEHAGTPLGDCVVAAARPATFAKFQAERQGFSFKFRL